MTFHHPELYCTTEDVVAGIGVRSRVNFRKGDFIGFYTGIIMSNASYAVAASNDDQMTQIGFAIEGTDCVVVRRNEADIVGFINEVPFGRESNVVAVPLHLEQGNAVAYFAAQFILAHVELLVHYGDAFERNYSAGNEAAIPKRLQRADSVLSVDAMKNTHRYCAPRAMKSFENRESKKN